MDDEDSARISATSSLIEVSADPVTGLSGATAVNTNSEKSSGGNDLEPGQGANPEYHDEGDHDSVAVATVAAPKKKKKKSKSKGQRGLVEPGTTTICCNPLINDFFRESLLVSKNITLMLP